MAIKASFVLPVKNGSKYIYETLLTLINQSVAEIEIIVANDHSTDNTASEVMKIANKDKRVIYLDLPSGISGVSAARNYATKRAKGKIILPTDADDPNEPNRAHVSIKEIEENSADIFYGTLMHYYPDTGKANKRFFQPYDRELLKYINYISHAGASAYTKEIYEKVGGYDETIAIGEDYDLWLMTQEAGAKFCSKDVVLSRYTMHSQQTTASSIEIRHKWLKEVRKKHSIFEIDKQYVLENAQPETVKFFIKNSYYYNIWFDQDSIPKKE